MKNTLLLFATLFLLFSCDLSEDELNETTKGTLVLASTVAPMKLVEVNNAKTSATQETVSASIRIYDENWNTYASAYDIQGNYTLEMEVGNYTIHMSTYVMHEDGYSLYSQGAGEAAFEIKSGQETSVSVPLERQYFEVQPILTGFSDNAKIWIGPKGFKTNSNFLVDYAADKDGPTRAFEYFETPTADIVVEDAGKTKRFNMKVERGTKYVITINNQSGDGNDGEGEEEVEPEIEPGTPTGNLTVEYTLQEQEVKEVTFNF